jgi:DNA-binding NarL/FixJ family response regulator
LFHIESIAPALSKKQVSADFGVFSPMNPLAAALRSSEDEQPQRLRVLVVDDQLLYAEAISVLLRQQHGLEVVGIAGDGREGIEQAFALRPDVVLMDIEMPRLDGISATRWIRRNLPATRVLVMTALTGDEHVDDALGAGAAACIKKFSSAGDLIAAIEQIA